MTAAAVYLQHRGDHVGPSRAVFVDLRASATWEPTESQRVNPQPMVLLEALAEWIKAQVAASLDGPDVIVITDSLQANCQWISAPSQQPTAIAAAVRDARSAAMDDEPSTNLAWLGDVTPGYDASVEGLGDGGANVGGRSQGGKDGKSIAGGRQRLALIAQPDADVRVLLDLLDARRVTVRRVTTLWHAAALVMSADAAEGASSGGSSGGAERIVVEQGSAVTATVMIEASGLMTWCWGSRGLLLAGGTQRLPKHAPVAAVAAGRGPALRLTSPASESGRMDERPVVHVEKADIGRLVATWMSWSLQLGAAPERIVCIGPEEVVCEGASLDLAGYQGLGAVAAGLGKRWPGANINVLPDDEPVGEVLARLVDVENRLSSRAVAAAVDPRLSLQGLSSRPASASRSVYHWMGVALIVGAGAIGVLGWKLHSGAGVIASAGASISAERKRVLDSLPEMKFPDTADPLAIINARRAELQKTAAELRAEDPLLAEAERIFVAIGGIPDLTLQKLDLRSGGVFNSLEFHAPAEGSQPAELVDRLRASRSMAETQIEFSNRTNNTRVPSDPTKRLIRYGGNFRPTPAAPAARPAAPGEASGAANPAAGAEGSTGSGSGSGGNAGSAEAGAKP